MDGDLLDSLTGGDGHLDLIKVHVHDDNLSITLWSNFCFHNSLIQLLNINLRHAVKKKKISKVYRNLMISIDFAPRLLRSQVNGILTPVGRFLKLSDGLTSFFQKK